MTIRLSTFLVATLVLLHVSVARGDEPPVAPPRIDEPPPVTPGPDPLPSATAPAPEAFWPSDLAVKESPKAPYTQPFQMRSVIPKSGARIDTILGLYKTADDRNAQISVVLFSAQWRLVEQLALQLRWGLDSNQTGNSNTRTGVVNPTVGALFGVPVGRDFRFAASVTVGMPLASGGGNDTDPNLLALQRQGQLARSALDNVSFSVNDVGFPTGVSFAYVKGGATAQIDATVIPSVRVKGEEVQSDTSKVNSTYGLFFGYLVIREISLGAELRYQSFISTPAAVDRDPSTRDNLTAAAGARFHLQLSDSVWVRPGLCYSRGLRGPVEQQSFQMVQLDVPVSF